MNREFRAELLEFLRDASKDSEAKYGYINPYLLAGIAQALDGTSEDNQADFVFEWADEYWGW
tara:strand:- start:60149 stop:60334 length:186 start_codon:yes stop_codon:yes gene_type:complete